MSRRKGRGGSKKAPPQTRAEGAVRIGRYLRWLYGSDVMPATLAEPLIDAVFEEIAAIGDPAMRRALLREVMDRAYDDLQDCQ